jgi:drug/metabolite transporter (DMT)-like permease
MHHVMFIAICLIWGSNFVLMKWAYTAFGPIGVGAGRVLGGAGVLWVVWALSRRETRGGTKSLSKGDWLALMVPVTIGSIYPYIAQPHLIGKHQDSAFFGMMVALVPLITVVASVPMLRVLPTARQACGVLLGLACMGLLFRAGSVRGMSGWDLLLAALVPTSYALSNTFIKRRLSTMPSLFMTAMILGLTSIVLTPVGVIVEGVKPVSGADLFEALLVMAWLGVVGTGVATVMFYRLVQTRGPLYAGMVTYVIPLGALSWGWYDGETVAGMQLLALVGVFAAVAMVQWQRRKAEVRCLKSERGFN